MQVVSFDPRYLDWVLDRTKTKTTRYGDPVKLGPARLRFESSPPVWVDAVITDIRDVALADLSDEDATAENCSSVPTMRRPTLTSSSRSR